jgi:hypothetical protein
MRYDGRVHEISSVEAISSVYGYVRLVSLSAAKLSYSAFLLSFTASNIRPCRSVYSSLNQVPTSR